MISKKNKRRSAQAFKSSWALIGPQVAQSWAGNHAYPFGLREEETRRKTADGKATRRSSSRRRRRSFDCSSPPFFATVEQHSAVNLPPSWATSCTILRRRYCLHRAYTRGNNYKDHNLAKSALDDNEPFHQPWRNFLIPTAVLAIAGAALYIHHNDEKRAIPKGSGTTDEKRNVSAPVIGGPFKLYDTEINLVTESSFQGNWTIMYFGYTSSPDVGPGEVKKMAELVDILETLHSVSIKPVFITIDPQRDSPAQMKAYLKEFHPKIMGLTGPIHAVRKMAQEYRVYFKKVDEEGQDYLVESSNNMYLLGPNMQIVGSFGLEYNASQIG